ncbi:MAG TPA: Hsp20/alpha crystallin family protein [Candidatus Limnocylindria bacterium]|jgi:HSP20 family protein|nr:Hsp20/alpha crystallin family protein [Candidatus Limnocylindria bacterium]
MANITRFDPFREMLTLRQAMDRLFEDSVVSPASLRTLAGDGATVNPALDLRETDDDLVVTIALPGVKPEDVNITITGQNLQVRGELKADESVRRDDYLYRERRFGTFARQLELPVRVKGDAAAASFDNGLLTLTIPKAEEVKPRQIEIKAAATDATPAQPVEADGGASA